MYTVQPRSIVSTKTVNSHNTKVVTFCARTVIWQFRDDDYDRSTHPMAILNAEEVNYLHRLQTRMRNGELISNTDDPTPLPSRKVYFNNFINAWKKREKNARIDETVFLEIDRKKNSQVN